MNPLKLARSWFRVTSSGAVFTFSSLVALISSLACCPAFADAPPVRIAVVQGGGSGMEQDVVDQVSQQLQGMDGVALGGANPDWYVVCNIKENIDQVSGQIRYNGNVLVKTVGGKIVVNPVAVQKYNQDFSTSPGAPLNKTLVDRAARDVINNLASRAVQPIQQAVMVEMDGRSRVNEASELASQNKFDEALAVIEQITPDFVEFAMVQKLHDKIVKDKKAKLARDAAAKHGGRAPAKASKTTTVTTTTTTVTTTTKSTHSAVTPAKGKPAGHTPAEPTSSGSKSPPPAGVDPKAILNEFSGAKH